MPEPRRHFLGWTAAPLARAAEWLLDEIGEDMGRIIVALPGARAGRQLGEHLARRAAPSWVPPLVLTQGQLVDELVPLDRPVAPRLVRTLAWGQALGRLARDELRAVAPRAAERDDLRERMRLAETVRSLHGVLAPEGIGFARLAAREFPPENEGEGTRWKALAAAQKHWRRALADLGVCDPHDGRSTAIEQGHVDRGRRVVLVGVADMNHLLVRLLESIASQVTALVVAPEEVAQGFDEWGRLHTDYWKGREVPLDLDRWHVAEKPVDQADRVSAVITGWKRRFTAEEVTIGLADQDVAPYLERRLASGGTLVRNAAGLPLARTRPFRLLRACARFLEERSFAGLAALARHPDLDPLLRAGQGLFAADPGVALDAYHREHLPGRADGEWVDDQKRTPPVRAIHAACVATLGELARPKARAARAWAAPIRGLLERVYGQAELDPEEESERVLAAALASVADVLSELEEVPDALGAPSGSGLGAADALELVLRQLRGQSIPPRPPASGESTVELLGWLELPLDEAPALVVTGFNEGRVPESVQGDPFLPDGMRRHLGLQANEDRLARDVYTMHVLVHARAEAAFVTGRRTIDGDPLVPSRLAFHAPPDEIAERVQRFLPSEDERRGVPAAAAGLEAATDLPRLETSPVLASMSVSSFRTFLDSPYLFYLRHVAKVEEIDDRARELDPRNFGIMAHDVLHWFGEGELKDSTDTDAIAKQLAGFVERFIAQTYGKQPLPAIILQAEQLKYRFQCFARKQAERARAGWRIAHAEWKAGESAVLDVDDSPMPIRGRIDRIDHHPQHGWAVIDYKTGERGKDPAPAHRRKDGTWTDLQLPLYRHLVRALGIEDLPALGYVTLGKDEGEIGFRFADTWSAADVDEGLDAARDVVRAVRAGAFFETGRRSPSDEEPILGALCGVGLIGGGDIDDEGGA